MAQQRRQYTREFKVEAVRLVVEEERPLAQVAREQ
jgi:transposase-like protein